MQAIKVQYNGEVFVPLEPVKAKHIKEAMVIIVGEEAKDEIRYGSKEYEYWKPLPDGERMKLAYEEYKAKFPESDVELEDFRYVGIAPPTPVEDDKKILIDVICEKYERKYRSTL